MNKTACTAFIVEGRSREPQIINSMKKLYFKNSEFKIITLAAEQNVYMLWKQMKQDDFETDIIEIIRESSADNARELNNLTRDSFSEIFLFFDYDAHHLLDDRLEEDALSEMLTCFDNETENGKLYISYPMAEVLRDYAENQCTPITACIWPVVCFKEYKNKSGMNCPNQDITKYGYTQWKSILEAFAMRVSCLSGARNVLSFEAYREQVSPLSIYEWQRIHIEKEEIFLLSAFPQFILDYFRYDFWHSHISNHSLRPIGACSGHLASLYQFTY